LDQPSDAASRGRMAWPTTRQSNADSCLGYPGCTLEAEGRALVREAGSSFRVLVPASTRVCEQTTASAGFLRALCLLEEGLQKPGKDFGHAVLVPRAYRSEGSFDTPDRARTSKDPSL
jgi:hypothetical protein